jgi:hypothetical protein
MRPEATAGSNGGTDGHPAVQEFLATMDRIRSETTACDGYDLDGHVASMRSLRVRVEVACAGRARTRRGRRLAERSA